MREDGLQLRVGPPQIGRSGLTQSIFQRLRKQNISTWLVGFACGANMLIAGCSRPAAPSASIAIEHEISPEPARVGPAVITIKLADGAGKPVNEAHIGVEADMTHPGMSPVFAEAKETDPGRYQAHLEFPMAGDWVVLLHVTLPGGAKLERQIDVRGVRPN
jgi:YtkA-like protein